MSLLYTHLIPPPLLSQSLSSLSSSNLISHLSKYYFHLIPVLSHYVSSIFIYSYSTIGTARSITSIISILSRSTRASLPMCHFLPNYCSVQQYNFKAKKSRNKSFSGSDLWGGGIITHHWSEMFPVWASCMGHNFEAKPVRVDWLCGKTVEWCMKSVFSKPNSNVFTSSFHSFRYQKAHFLLCKHPPSCKQYWNESYLWIKWKSQCCHWKPFFQHCLVLPTSESTWKSKQ